MAREIPLVRPDELPRDDTAGLELDHLVDQQERLPMGQDRLDLVTAERRLGHGNLVYGRCPGRSPARMSSRAYGAASDTSTSTSSRRRRHSSSSQPTRTRAPSSLQESRPRGGAG